MCASGSVDHLESGKDTFLSCKYCGGGANSTRLVPQVRSKNCSNKEDKTRVASDPTADAHTSELEAYANGPENADARRRRHLMLAGGTRLSAKTCKKHDLSKAQSRIDTSTARAMRESLDASSRDANRKRAILRMVEAVFDQLPNLHEGIQKYIRLEAIRIYTLSMTHDRVCGQKSCYSSISSRSNCTVSYCMVENILEKLCEPYERAKQTLADKCQGEVTQLQLRGYLAKLKALQLRHASVQQRLQVASAIDIIANWNGLAAQTKCPPPAEAPRPPPSPLQLPNAMMTMMTPTVGNGHGSAACDNARMPSPHAPFVMTSRLRDRISAACKMTESRSEIGTAAIDSLMSARVVDFLREAKGKALPLPTDLLAIGLLIATARKLNKDTIENHKVVHSMLQHHSIAATTMNHFVDELAGVLETLPVKPADDLPLW